jgi:predicted MFS family arabinose efflux permease
MEENKNFWFGFAGFVVVIMVAFALNGILDIAGFETTYLESIINQHTIQGEAAKNKIETSLNLGKRLHLLRSQYDEIFISILRQNPGIQHFYIVNIDNTIIYTTRPESNQVNIPFVIEHTNDLSSEAGERPPVNTVKFLDAYYICIPLYSDNHYFQGTLITEFSAQEITAYINKVSLTVFRFAIILILCSLGMYLLLSRIIKHNPKSEAVILITLLLVSQSIFTIHNNRLYNTIISNVFNDNMSVLAKSIAEELRIPLDYGIKIDNLGDANNYLAKRIEGNPQCLEAYITDVNLVILFKANRSSTHPLSAKTQIEMTEYSSEYSTRLSRHDPDLTTIQLISNVSTGYLVLRINRPMINSILLDIAMDSLTIIVVALIFAFILRDFFIFMSLRKQLIIRNNLIKNNIQATDFDFPQYGLRLIKVSTFIFLFAAFETLSFIPLLIQKVYKSNPIVIFGLSEETIYSLPMGLYMLGITFAMFMSIFILKNMNIWKRHILMTIVFIIGSAATIYADTFNLLMLFRFITGIGFGGVLLNLTSLVMFYTSDKNRSVGFGTNAAAFAAASICSIPVGGIVVSKFGYDVGIMVSVIFAFLVLFFSITCMSSERRKNAQQRNVKQIQEEANEERFSFANFLRVVRSKHVIVYLACINLPFQLIYVGLFQFILPYYMNDSLGLSHGNIGRLLSIFCIISLGAAYISRLSDWAKNDKLLISIGAFIAGIILIMFSLIPEGSLVIFFAVLIGMGIDNLFVDSIEEVYVSSGKIKGISDENIIQSYKATEKIVSVFLPTLTGLIITLFGFNASMMFIGLWSAIGAVAFVFLGINGRWEKEKMKEGIPE